MVLNVHFRADSNPPLCTEPDSKKGEKERLHELVFGDGLQPVTIAKSFDLAPRRNADEFRQLLPWMRAVLIGSGWGGETLPNRTFESTLAAPRYGGKFGKGVARRRLSGSFDSTDNANPVIGDTGTLRRSALVGPTDTSTAGYPLLRTSL